MDELNEIEELLKEGSEIKSKKLVNRMVYSMPEEWLEIITDNNFKFSQFAKMAIREKIEEIIKKDIK